MTWEEEVAGGRGGAARGGRRKKGKGRGEGEAARVEIRTGAREASAAK
jgi:hypothetical protein